MAAYATVAEVKARIDKSRNDDDATLTALILSASQAVDNLCNRPDGFEAVAVASARVYPGRGLSYLNIDECIAVTAVAVKDSVDAATYTAWAPTDWVAFRGDPEEPEFNRLPYTGIMVDPDGDYATFLDGRLGHNTVRTCQVTARWGYAATAPYAIKEATILLVAQWYKRAQSAWADTVGLPDYGMLLYRQKLDPALWQMLIAGRYVRPNV